MNLVYLTGNAADLERVLLMLRDHPAVINIAYVTERGQAGEQTICMELRPPRDRVTV